MIRLLLDQGLPRSTVRHLQDQDVDVCHVADIGLSRSSDTEITEHARSQGRLIYPSLTGIWFSECEPRVQMPDSHWREV